MEQYDDVIRQNDLDETSGLDALGIYVYVLQDPASGYVFYIGKGGGTTASAYGGNERIIDHFNEATDWLRLDKVRPTLPPKLRSILDIWKRGEAVNWFVVRHSLPDEATAFHIEASLIDLLPLSPNGALDNAVSGVRALAHGLLSPAGVADRSAPSVSPLRPYARVYVFPIAHSAASLHDKYQALRSAWSAGKAVRKVDTAQPAIAVGVASGLSRIVATIEGWEPVPDAPGKWAFNGQELPNSELLGKNFTNVIAPALGYWMRGRFIGIRFDGAGHFQFIHGRNDRTPMFQCT